MRRVSVGRGVVEAAREIEEAVVSAALSLDDPTLREAFLQRCFPGDEAGLARVRALVQAALEASPYFWEAREEVSELAREAVSHNPLPTRKEVSAADPLGEFIGRYRVLEKLGEGGCGVVYKAEQCEPVRRLVALKVIRLGMDTQGVIARFEQERQALAMMDHPHIARVLDAGATKEGRPYFVMELVGGQPVTTFCDSAGLGVSARLRLFIQICHAVQHAHQKGLIHRDLKPSNILVESLEGVPVPKVIDFGVAKAAEGRLPGQQVVTEWDQLIGTPAYMSPEQVDLRGMDIDTRSDVYSLGMVLYELLAGKAPYAEADPRRLGMAETRRLILEREPLPPSAVAPPERRAWLRGDLDAIVLKAIEKDRDRRYQTANSLAMDVRRFLEHQPVLARRPGRLYHMSKFVRRHRLACLAAAAVALSLMGGLASSTWLYWRERQALAEQVRLAREAEEARQQEARLREQAQARAEIVQAAGLIAPIGTATRYPADHDFAGVAALIDAGQAEEVDERMRSLPLESLEPSPDAARVFRSLGHWNALLGRWGEARQCFEALHRVNRFTPPEGILEGTDLMCLAVLLAEHAPRETYLAFRQEAMDRHLPVVSALGAEHLLKSCLLHPAGPEELARLQQAVEMCASGRRSEYSGRDSFPQWDALAQAMYYHRTGDTERVLEWTRRSLDFPGGRGDRECSTRCLRSMALLSLGEIERSRRHLEAARALMARSPLAKPPSQPLWLDIWVDWCVARLLWREAEAKWEGVVADLPAK